MVYIAVDIGASSGRLVLGKKLNNKIEIKEIHRFANGFTEQNGVANWDIDHLLNEILKGLAEAKSLGYEACTVGIDTWGVDYALVGKDGKRLKEVTSYRDKRTEQTYKKIHQLISEDEIYQKTGIQFLPFNSIYQLFEEENELKDQTDKILLVPDYLGYRLTGKAVSEVTNLSTTQLLNIHNRSLDQDLLEIVNIKPEQFPPFVEPGHTLGLLKNEWFPDFDLPICKIINVASHDTASAVVGTPGLGEHWAYLSSGTWSLIGIESSTPIVNDLGFVDNYTNEWGAFHTFRFLKNIIGMWIMQEVRRNLPDDYTFSKFVEEAKKITPFQQFINFNENRFLNPENMIKEIRAYCSETNQPIPETAGELAACVFNNLSIIYAIAMNDIEKITNQKIDNLYIVGGGAHNNLLNQLTADLSGRKIFAGPTEATAIGNLVMQMIANNEIKDIQEGREIIRNSFEIKEFLPNEINRNDIIQKFKAVTNVKE